MRYFVSLCRVACFVPLLCMVHLSPPARPQAADGTKRTPSAATATSPSSSGDQKTDSKDASSGSGGQPEKSASGSGTATSKYGNVTYVDLKNHKVSLPYGEQFLITGSIADVQIVATPLNNLMSVQTVSGDYAASDGVKGTIAPSNVSGTTWKATIEKLNADTSLTVNFVFTGTLVAELKQTILEALLANPTYQAAVSNFVAVATGRPSPVQVAASLTLAQTAADTVASILKAKGLIPKNPDDVKNALNTVFVANIEPLFNLYEQIRFLKNPALQIADVLGMSTTEFLSLSVEDIDIKLKGVREADFVKIKDEQVRKQAEEAIHRFLQTYDNVKGPLLDSVKAALFTGSSSLVLGNDTQSAIVSDLKKYAGFDLGMLYSFRLNELRSFAMVHIYFGPVQLKTEAPADGKCEWLRQRLSLTFGLALKDFSGGDENKSKIVAHNAFAYGLGFRLNKYFRLSAGDLLYRAKLPAINGVSSPVTNSLRHEFFAGPSIDVTALPALKTIFAKSKSD